jgi:hypothetical protein
MVRTHLTVELTIEYQDKLYAASPNPKSWAIMDVEYVCEMIHLDPTVDRALMEANSGGIVVPFATYSQHRWIAPANSGSMSMAFSSPFKSLKTLIGIFRKDVSNYVTADYISKRTNPILDTGRYQFTINGVLTPSKPIGTNSEAFAEAQKAFHAYGCLEHMGVINHANWTATDGTYAIAMDLESQSHKSMLSQNGVDVSTSVSHLTAQFAGQLATSLTVDLFSHYDSFIVIGADGLVNVFY